jgi:hypothetical protein
MYAYAYMYVCMYVNACKQGFDSWPDAIAHTYVYTHTHLSPKSVHAASGLCVSRDPENEAEWYAKSTLISIMTVFFFLDKKNSSSNSGAKAHCFGLCSQRSVSM